jgi:hypothetical protein
MTIQQLTEKIYTLIEQGKPEVDKLIQKVINSGTIDVDAAENDFLLPKIVLSAIYSELSYECQPLSASGRKSVDNLKKFL